MFVTIAVQLLGTTVFAYVIGGVMNLVINFDPAERAYKQEMQLLNEYMRFAKLKNSAKSSYGLNLNFSWP